MKSALNEILDSCSHDPHTQPPNGSSRSDFYLHFCLFISFSSLELFNDSLSAFQGGKSNSVIWLIGPAQSDLHWRPWYHLSPPLLYPAEHLSHASLLAVAPLSAVFLRDFTYAFLLI